MQDRGWQYTAATVLVSAGLAIGWCMYDMLGQIADYSIMWDPPQAREVLKCCLYGLMAVGAALKLDIPLVGNIVKTDVALLVAKLTSPTPPPTTPPGG